MKTCKAKHISVLLACILFSTASALAQYRIKNEKGEPIGILDIPDSKGDKIAVLYITGIEAAFDANQRLLKGAGYIQAEKGKHIHVSIIIERSKPKEGASNIKQLVLGLNRIEWDDDGKTTAASGMEPIIETSLGEKWKITSNLEKPAVKNGLLLVYVEGKGKVSLDIKFGDKGKVVGNPDFLF